MDKIAHKLSSQDIIQANSAADAAELESLENQLTIFRQQMEKYDDCLQEMRKLNLKNIESAQEVQVLADKANEKLGQTAGEVEAVSVSKIKESSDHLDKITENMSGLQEKQEELFKNLEDFLHTDNVKVYRNVQAAMQEELEKQTSELKEDYEKAAGKSGVLLPFVIITMIISIANLSITIARILNLF